MNSDTTTQALELSCQVGAQRVTGWLILRRRLAPDHLVHAGHHFALTLRQPPQYFTLIRVRLALRFRHVLLLLLFAALRSPFRACCSGMYNREFHGTNDE